MQYPSGECFAATDVDSNRKFACGAQQRKNKSERQFNRELIHLERFSTPAHARWALDRLETCKRVGYHYTNTAATAAAAFIHIHLR